MRVGAAALIVGMLTAATAWGQEPPDAYPAPPEAYPAPPAQPAPQPPPPGYQPPAALPPPPVVHSRPSTRVEQRIAIYAELAGKGIAYGAGMDVNFTKWIGIGGLLSYLDLDGFAAGIFAPYLALYAGGYKSAFVAHVGPQILFARTGDWWIWKEDGSPAGGQVSVGYEYRDGFLFRAMVTLFFNEEGTAFWPLGFSFGGAF